jgi:hypothetical protein
LQGGFDLAGVVMGLTPGSSTLRSSRIEHIYDSRNGEFTLVALTTGLCMQQYLNVSHCRTRDAVCVTHHMDGEDGTYAGGRGFSASAHCNLAKGYDPPETHLQNSEN